MNFAPERLREIRLLSGHTMEMMAEKIGVSKQAVSKYEAGQAVPATDTLARILDQYGIRPDYLTNKRELPNDRSTIFYRKVKNTPIKKREVAEVNVKWLYEIITVMDGITSMKKLNLPEFPQHLPIWEKAKLLRGFWNLGEEVIDDIVSLLEANGFYLFTVNWGEEKIDGYSQMIGSRPIIVLNGEKGTKERQQFSIAHELGHMILHRNAEKVTEEMEKEADEFAGCFLMPERALKADLVRNNADYFVELSKKWRVSPQALVERCRNLKLLGRNEEENEAKRMSLYQKLNRRIIREESDIICTIRPILDLMEEDVGTAKNFLRELRLPVRELQRLCGLSDKWFSYEQPDRKENINNIEGTQISFSF